MKLKLVQFCTLWLLLVTFLLPCRADFAQKSLEGLWQGSNGRDVLSILFQGQNMVLTLNGQKVTGNWNLLGQTLNLRFQNGKVLNYHVAWEGQTLVLDSSIRLNRQNNPLGGQASPQNPFGSPQKPQQTPPGFGPANPFGMATSPAAGPLDGMWSTTVPQGKRSFRFQGNQYAQLLNGQVLEEGQFLLSPDGRFRFQVTQGAYAGQQGENRLKLQPNAFTMFWPDGQAATFYRENQPMLGQGATSPLEGRWIWAKQGPVSFSYVFSGNRFVFYYNGQQCSSGTFTLGGAQLVMHHETGVDQGKTDYLGYQLNGNRLLIFTTQDQDPIPFVRN
ncbi:MAG: hypothetical protein IJS50_04020 [Desulfovibrio sp.]|nr:hypothetical protein [Desulfovibrio sp.]